MNMKEANLEAEVDINDDGVVVVFNVIKPAKGEPKEFIKVLITPDKLKAHLNEISFFTFQEFSLSKIDTLIEC